MMRYSLVMLTAAHVCAGTPGTHHVGMNLRANGLSAFVNGICDSVHNLNCEGQDLHDHGKVTTHEECCNACSAYSGCTAWTWNWKVGDCYLKSGCADQTADSDCHSGQVAPAPTPIPTPPAPPTPSPPPTPTPPPTPALQCGVAVENIDYQGGSLCDYKDCETAASAEECCAICHSTSDCVAASLFEGLCYTKSDMSKPVYKSGCMGIPMSQPDSSQWFGAGKVQDKSFWKSMRGIGFAPADDRGPSFSKEHPAQIARLDDALTKVVANGFNFIRTWHTNDYQRLMLQHIRDRKLDIKVQLGVGVYDDSGAKKEIDEAVAIAKQYPDLVLSLSVGNEGMWWGNGKITAEMALAHATYAKQAYGVPVTYDFVVESITHATGRAAKSADLCAGLDYLSVHMYGGNYYHGHRDDPSWTPDKQIAAVHDEAQGVQDKVGHLGKPVVVGETGWQSRMYVTSSVAHLQEYFTKITKHVYGETDPLIQSMIYFELNDEQWKGKDDAWGLYDQGNASVIGDADGNPKFQPINLDEILALESSVLV